jgi:hypothetical protein
MGQPTTDGQPVSDAAFKLLGACVHSLRFSFGAPLHYPYATRLAEDNPPPALFRRVQAVSPPPDRDGDRWQTGMTLDGRPFDPQDEHDRERLGDVQGQEGASSLDVPEPEKIVLDLWFDVPREQQTGSVPEPDRGRYLLSIPYWKPRNPSGAAVPRTIEYSATHRMDWARRPEDDWVAVSFDAFWPPERDSADLIVLLGDCDERCPRSP